MPTYLLELNARLARGLARRPAELRARHAAFVARGQQPDGGWTGREGESDLYYTGFALRGLAVLGALTPEVCNRAGGGPEVLAESPADWPRRVTDTLGTFRTKDGGYNKSVGSPSGSTYHTFL